MDLHNQDNNNSIVQIYSLSIVVLYRLPHFRSVPIFDYFKFQVADVSIRYRLLQTYNKTYKIITFCQN